MSWKRYLKRLTRAWPQFSTVGEVHVHVIIVEYDGLRNGRRSEEGFLRMIRGPVDLSSGVVPVKHFYENLSRGRLRFGRVTAERFVVSRNIVEARDVWAQYFRAVCESHRDFVHRTHFMFALEKAGACGLHKNYILAFDASLPNESTIIHEFGHNLGLMHATTSDSDRGDESDRMGAQGGYIEFNAPNLVWLGWLDAASVCSLVESQDCILTPLEFANAAEHVPRVIMIPISASGFLYLSMRERIGPYDSRHLDPKYAGRLSIHTHGLDDNGKPTKTRLVEVLGENAIFRCDDPHLLKNYRQIEISNLRRMGDTLHFHVQLWK